MAIYHQAQHPLNTLFTNAGNGMLMIPDLQREYVWKPMQIIRLIDSLLREWPYSTLLLWNSGFINSAPELVPHHPFRTIISRLPQGIPNKTRSFMNAAYPGIVTMVLDGQQRLQSLMLAFGQSDAGLYLLDKEWMMDMSEDGDHPYRGKYVNSRWMFGQLFFNLDALKTYVDRNDLGGFHLHSDINYSSLFRWACPGNHANYVSENQRSLDYSWPIDKLWDINPTDLDSPQHGKNRYIHASCLWEAARGFNNVGDNNQIEKVVNLLKSQNANSWDNQEEFNKISYGLISFLKRLASVQQQMVGCLELSNMQDSGIGSVNDYNEAVVSIFTRLNAAGRTLEPEEITFAWLKNKWNQLKEAHGHQIEGAQIAQKIIEQFKTTTILTESQAIRLLSHIWVAFEGKDRGFRLMSASDQLDGKTITLMAQWLFNNWTSICRSLADVSDSLKNSLFLYGSHFRSVNAISPLIIYRFGILQRQPNGGLAGDWINVNNQFNIDSLKWLATSLFAGKWAKNSDADLAKCVSKLGELAPSSPDLTTWRKSFIDTLESDTKIASEKYISNFNPDQQTYNKARPILAVWAHCDSSRRILTLRLKDATIYKGTIDHITPQAQWKANPFVQNESEDFQDKIHQLGNLMELDASDNPTKNSKLLTAWLEEKPNLLEEIKYAFCISDESCSIAPNSDINVNILCKVIDVRTEKIKSDVIAFLKNF